MCAESGLAALQRPQGGFAMVALDQRESLRAMLGTQPASDDALREFKKNAADALSPWASAVLLDRLYGTPDPGAPALACSLVLAADAFVQPFGQPVADSTLDPAITVDTVHALGAAALKLLVIWRGSEAPDRRGDLVDRFLELCDVAGVPGIVEGVVRPSSAAWSGDSERNDAIVAAAAEFGRHRAGLYKAEVPSYGRDLAEVERRSVEVTAVLPCPWVVLSSGVAATDFPDSVAAACRGGASGFLAGRAIWADAAALVDPVPALRDSAVARLQKLNEVVPAR